MSSESSGESNICSGLCEPLLLDNAIRTKSHILFKSLIHSFLKT